MFFKPKKLQQVTMLTNFKSACSNLVGGFNPFEKYARQIGSFPQGSG